MAFCVEVCFVPKDWDPCSQLPVGVEWTHAGYNLERDLVNQASGGSGHLSPARTDGGYISPRPSRARRRGRSGGGRARSRARAAPRDEPRWHAPRDRPVAELVHGLPEVRDDGRGGGGGPALQGI